MPEGEKPRISVVGDGKQTDVEIAARQVQQDVIRIFDELHQPLYRYLVCQGLSRDEAGDGVQEIFLRLHQHIRTGRDQTNLRGWIFQVARNFARNERKSVRRMRNEPLEEKVESRLASQDAGDNPENEFLRQERLERFRTGMAKLTPQQRECVLMRVGGMKYREIAEVLGIGISAVGELVQRATSRLTEECYD